MKTLRVGIVGFGFIGKVHAYGYLNLPLFYDGMPVNARITHVCDGNKQCAERGREQVGADFAVTDFREITENPDIDVVDICLPNHIHRDALLSAIRHNKHIYCEKPLVTNWAEAEEIRKALAGHQGTTQMTLQSRFYPASMRARQLIDEGFLGQVLEFRASYLHAGSANPEAPLKWKLSAEAGGGVIADLGSHVFDLVHFLLGDFESITAASHIAFPDRPSADDPSKRVPVEVEDCVMLLARMRNGALGHVEATKLATGVEDEMRFEIHGSKGALRFNSMAPHFLEAFDATAPDSPIGGNQGWNRINTGQRFPAPAAAFPGPKFYLGWIRVHAACLANFLHQISLGRPGDPGLDQGIYVQYLMDRVRDSVREGAWVQCLPKDKV